MGKCPHCGCTLDVAPATAGSLAPVAKRTSEKATRSRFRAPTERRRIAQAGLVDFDVVNQLLDEPPVGLAQAASTVVARPSRKRAPRRQSRQQWRRVIQFVLPPLIGCAMAIAAYQAWSGRVPAVTEFAATQNFSVAAGVTSMAGPPPSLQVIADQSGPVDVEPRRDSARFEIERTMLTAIDMSAQLQTPLDRLSVKGLALNEFLRLMSNLSGIPITVNIEALTYYDVSAATPITIASERQPFAACWKTPWNRWGWPSAWKKAI